LIGDPNFDWGPVPLKEGTCPFVKRELSLCKKGTVPSCSEEKFNI